MVEGFRNFVLLILLKSVAPSVFNPDELLNIHYDVDILGEPKLMTETIQSPTSMTILSKHGQRYECILPANVYTMGQSGDAIYKRMKEREAKEEEEVKKTESDIVSIPKLLDGMEEGPCLKLSKGWWEYELCFRHRIRQYHRNEQTGAIENEIVLGEYASDFDWETTKEQVQVEKSTAHRKGPSRHTQEYNKGSVCDLTGNQRRAEVVFHCDLSPQAVDVLTDVEEPVSCVYRLTVKTPRLCLNPLLKRAAEDQTPSRRHPPEIVQCRPLLQPESMQKYKKVLEIQEAAKRREAEIKRLNQIYKENKRHRAKRIVEILTSKYRGPLRRRKYALLTGQHYSAFRRRLFLAEEAVKAAGNVLNTAGFFSSEVEQSLKQMTKRLKAKFTASHMTQAQKKLEDKKAAKLDKGEEKNVETFRKAMATLPEEVRRKLTSEEGLNILKTGLGAQLQQILDEAKSAVGGEGNDVEGGREELLKKMSDMVDQLLTQVNTAGKRLEGESEMLEAQTKRILKEREARTTEKAPRDEKQISKPSTGGKDEVSEKMEKDEQRPNEKVKPGASSNVEKPSEVTSKSADDDDDPEFITVPAQTSESEGASNEIESHNTGVEKEALTTEDVEKMRGRLESELRQKMSKRGMDSNVLLHVMTVRDKDGDGDSGRKEKPSFVGIIILKNDQQQREEERMKRLDKNYNFRIDNIPPS